MLRIYPRRLSAVVAPSMASSRAQQRIAQLESMKGSVSPFLTDSFGRQHDYLRISLTEKCNLRCRLPGPVTRR